MSTEEMVQELKNLGCHVSVKHKRKRYNVWVRVDAETMKLRRASKKHGGSTIATITTATGESYTAKSICRKNELYDGNMGAEIALGRAYKALHKHMNFSDFIQLAVGK